jgi:hypothetical protein
VNLTLESDSNSANGNSPFVSFKLGYLEAHPDVAEEINFHQKERARHDEAARKERDELKRIDHEILGAFRDEERKGANSVRRPSDAAPDPASDVSCAPAGAVIVPPADADPFASDSMEEPFATPEQELSTPPPSIQTPPIQNQTKSPVISDGSGQPLNALMLNHENPSSSSTTGASGQRETTMITPPSSKSNGTDLTPIDTAARQVCNPDSVFVRKLIDLCRANAPDCTVEEVVAGIEAKIEIKRGRSVGNWMGYLLTAVPLLFGGESLKEFRATRAGSDLMPQKNAPSFEPHDWRACLENRASVLPQGYQEIAASLRKLATDPMFASGNTDFDALEQRLTVLNEKMIDIARARQSEEQARASSRELERQLRTYRGKMTADQISKLEKQYREQDLLEGAGLERLGLCFML